MSSITDELFKPIEEIEEERRAKLSPLAKKLADTIAREIGSHLVIPLRAREIECIDRTVEMMLTLRIEADD